MVIMKTHIVEDDESGRVDLICRREYGSYNSIYSKAVMDVNPTVKIWDLGTGDVINIPTLEEIYEMSKT